MAFICGFQVVCVKNGQGSIRSGREQPQVDLTQRKSGSGCQQRYFLKIVTQSGEIGAYILSIAPSAIVMMPLCD